MTVDFDLDSVRGVAVGVVHGELSVKEIKESAAAMWKLQEGPAVRILWDLRDARLNLSAGEVRESAEYGKVHSPYVNLRMAFLVAKDLEFGLSRMFEVFRESAGARTSVFRDEEQALEWLANEDD